MKKMEHAWKDWPYLCFEEMMIIMMDVGEQWEDPVFL